MTTLVGDHDVTVRMYLKSMEDRYQGRALSSDYFVDLCGGKERTRSCCSHLTKWLVSDTPNLARIHVFVMLFLLADDMGSLANAFSAVSVSSYQEARLRADIMSLAEREPEAREAYAVSNGFLRSDSSSMAATLGCVAHA